MLNKVQGCLALAQEPPRTAPHDVNVLASLTPRERQVLDLVVIGKASKRIAYELHISVKTVERHRENVMRKMGAENVAHLVRIVLSS